MNYFNLNFFVGEFYDGLLYSLHRALDVALYYEVERFHVAFGNLAEYFVEGNLRSLLNARLALLSLPLLYDLLHQLLRYGVYRIARIGNFFKAENGYRRGRSGRFYLPALVVYHGAHAARYHAGDDVVAGVEGAVLHENARHGAHALIELSLYYGAARLPVGVGEQLLHLCDEENIFEQVIYALARLCGYGADYRVAAPLFGNETVVSQILFYFVYIGALFIHLVYGDDYGYARGFGVVYRLYRLRHYAVVGGNDEDYYIGNLRAARPHRRERLVSGRIEEGYLFIAHRNGIGAYVLGDAARLALGDLGLSYIVQKGSLAVVYVTHYGYDGCAGNETFNLLHRVGLFFNQLFFGRLFGLIFELYAEVGGNHERRFVVDRAVYSRNHALLEEALGYLNGGDAEFFGEHLDGDIVGSYDGVVNLYLFNDLLCRLFGARFAVYAPLVVEVLHARALLLYERALV